MTRQKTINSVNGVNVDALNGTVEAMQAEPDLGKTRFHVHNEWTGGAHNRGTITDFISAGEPIAHKHVFTVDADEPSVLGGQDQGANPVEHMLNSLAACLTNSLICHAAAKGIEIKHLECDVQGDIDLNGFLGLSSDVRKGYKNITVKFKVDSDEQNREKLLRLAKFSPVFDTISNGTSVDVDIEEV